MAADTVFVACKLPSGLIMRLFKQVKITEPVLGGGTRETSVAEMVGEPVTIKGYGERKRKGIDMPSTAAVYEVTENISKEFMVEWFKQNAESPLVKNKIVLWDVSKDSLYSKMRENEKRRGGFEPLDPDALPKIAGPMSSFETKAA